MLIYHRKELFPVLCLMALNASAASVSAQSLALNEVGVGGGSRMTFGDCPTDVLRRAWRELLPLEVAAVESEVLALCTERAEAITRFLVAQRELNEAVGLVQDVTFTTEPAPAARPENDGVLARLRDEIRNLRERIRLLETGPEQPETAATLSRLRAELSAAEARLPPTRIEDAPAPVFEQGAIAESPGTPRETSTMAEPPAGANAAETSTLSAGSSRST